MTIAKELWNFPENLLCVIGHHHNMNGNGENEYEILVYTTKLSEIICDDFGFGYSDFSPLFKNDIGKIQRKLGISDASLSSIQIQLKKEFEKVEKSGWLI